ncbi:MAG TPA: hypothetical protein HA362_04900 [Nanoarchaeota archaeon]|nr:hypothetical protein [Nanoarchaeota archaeon]
MRIQTYQNVVKWVQNQKLVKEEIVDKEYAHEKGLLHLSAHLLIIDGIGGIFCRKRSDHELRYKGLWTTSVGIHVELDGDYLAFLKQSLPADIAIKWLGEFRVNDGYENEVCGLYFARVEENELPNELKENRMFITANALETLAIEGKITPHLKEAYLLLGAKNE